MKFVRVLSRLALLALAGAGFAVLTGIYGRSVHPPLSDPQWRTERGHRRSTPQVGRFPELIGEGLIVAIYAVIGRIVFRLRLFPASPKGQPTLLGLRRD
jgi:heme A synthase